MAIKRVFLIVLDSFGIGELPDAAQYGDTGSNTLATCARTGLLWLPTMAGLGLFSIDGVAVGDKVPAPKGTFGRLAEASKGKDTTVGHWEIAGYISKNSLPTYPRGFPQEVVTAFEKQCGYKVLCNLPYSGTDVIRDYGAQALAEKKLILYTSADSVFQLAAHLDVFPLKELYRICEIARELLQGEHAVGRVIARPFQGTAPAFTRSAGRHDYSLAPPGPTMLTAIENAGLSCIGVGKISDIFAGQGITQSHPTANNAEGMEKTMELLKTDFTGLCFTNLVDFDMVYGHRNDAAGYARALNTFDSWLAGALPQLRPEDVLMITADHGCDPETESTDHSREYVPILVYGQHVCAGVNLGTRRSFSDIGKTVTGLLNVSAPIMGSSFSEQLFTDTAHPAN